VRMSGSLQQSAEVMKSMQELVKVSDVAASMRDMSREMMKVKICFKFLGKDISCVESETCHDAMPDMSREKKKVKISCALCCLL